MIEIINVCLIPLGLFVYIKTLYIVIAGILIDTDVAAPPWDEMLAPQLEEWLDAQSHTSYDIDTLAKVFNVPKQAINGSMMSLLRLNMVGYDVIDNVKYYYRKG